MRENIDSITSIIRCKIGTLRYCWKAENDTRSELLWHNDDILPAWVKLFLKPQVSDRLGPIRIGQIRRQNHYDWCCVFRPIYR